MTKEENTKYNRQLKELSKLLKESYNSIREQGERAYKASLQPGETFRPQKGLYTETHRAAYQAQCDSLHARAVQLLAELEQEMKEKATTAPSTDAINMLNILKMRQEIPAEDIDNLMTKYGLECPLVYDALLEIARGQGYHDFRPHPISELHTNLEYLDKALDKAFSVSEAEYGNPIIAAAALDANIDITFPVPAEGAEG